MIADQRGAQSAARIAGGGLDVDLLEAAVAQDLAVRHAVERNAAGQAQIPDPGFLAQRSRQPQHDLLGHRLNRRRQVHVALRQELVRLRAAGRRTARRTSPFVMVRPVQ